MQKYDVAAYIWPAYTGKEERTRIFWPEGMGEWQSVKNSVKKTPEHSWPRKPLWGYVNEADPYVMESQISAAVDHGVNVFIYDWYWYDKRPFLENCLNDGFLKAKNSNNMKFYLMWANHDAKSPWDIRTADDLTTIWLGTVDRHEFEIIVNRVINQYFKQENYYKIDEKPVFMIYDVDNLIKGFNGVENTKIALEYFRSEVKKAGFPDVHLQLTAWGERTVDLSGFDNGEKYSTKDIVEVLNFDSITHYQFVHFTNINRDYNEILPDIQTEWDRIDANYKVPYYPHVSIGWDNNPRFRSYRPEIVKNNTPENVKNAFLMAKKYLDNHPERTPLITVNSWNEWTETSYLEPDDLYGYGYLESIKEVFKD